VALFTRYGTGQLPLPSTLIQSGDSLHVLAADDQRATLDRIAGNAPEAGQS
jgi:trk system potassium uptake protein TrkA